jgi:hypothetical protein
MAGLGPAIHDERAEGATAGAALSGAVTLDLRERDVARAEGVDARPSPGMTEALTAP